MKKFLVAFALLVMSTMLFAGCYGDDVVVEEGDVTTDEAVVEPVVEEDVVAEPAVDAEAEVVVE